jgi:hypothetical protein
LAATVFQALVERQNTVAHHCRRCGPVQRSCPEQR